MEKEEAPFPILESPSHRKEPALISFSVEPAEDFVHSESEGNVSTSSGRQVKPVQKDGIYYYYCLFNMLLGCQYNQFYMVIVMFYVMLLKILDSSANCGCAAVRCSPKPFPYERRCNVASVTNAFTGR